MAELKSGTTIGGAVPWTKASLNLIPSGNSINYKGFKIYTENDKPTNAETDTVSASKGGEYKANVDFKEGLKSSGLIIINSQQDSKLRLVDNKDTIGNNYLEFFDKTVRKAYIGFGSSAVDTFVIRNDRGNGTLQFNDKIHFNGVQLMDYNNITQSRGTSTTLVPSVKLVSDWMETKTNKTDAEDTYAKRSGSVMSGELNWGNKAPTTYAFTAMGNSADTNSKNYLRRFRHYNSGTLYHELVTPAGLEYLHGVNPDTLIFRLRSGGLAEARKGFVVVDNIDAGNSSGLNGRVASGAWVDWKTRPTMIEVRNTTTIGVSNIFKLVSSTGTAIAAIDGYSTTGDNAGTQLRIAYGDRSTYFNQDRINTGNHVDAGIYNVTANQLIATNNTDYVGVKLLKNDKHSLTLETAPDNAGYVGRLIYRNPSNANISITDIPRKNGVLAIQSENYTKGEADGRFASSARFIGNANNNSESQMTSPNYSGSAGFYWYVTNTGYSGLFSRTAGRSVFQILNDGTFTANKGLFSGGIETTAGYAQVKTGNIQMEMKTVLGYPEITTNFGSGWTNHRLPNKSGTIAHVGESYLKGETYTRAEVDSRVTSQSTKSGFIDIPTQTMTDSGAGNKTFRTPAKTITFSSVPYPTVIIINGTNRSVGAGNVYEKPSNLNMDVVSTTGTIVYKRVKDVLFNNGGTGWASNTVGDPWNKEVEIQAILSIPANTAGSFTVCGMTFFEETRYDRPKTITFYGHAIRIANSGILS